MTEILFYMYAPTVINSESTYIKKAFNKTTETNNKHSSSLAILSEIGLSKYLARNSN